MLPRERMLTALELGTPDRVPVWELGFNEESIIGIARHFTENVPPLKPVSDMSVEEKIQIFEAMCALVDGLDLDGITLMPLGRREKIAEKLVRDPMGIVYHLSDHGSPYPIEGPIKEASDLAKFKLDPPDPADLLGLRIGVQRFAGKRAIVLHSPGPFKLSWSLRGTMQNLLVDYMLQPKLAHELARMSTDHYMELHAMAIDEGAEVIALEGDLAHNTNTLMSPAQYAEFLAPYHTEIVENVHRRGAKIFKHSDGDLWPILDMLVECGFDGIHPFQPQCMDIGDAKRHLAGKTCVMGNIDCMYLLCEGTEAEVEQSVRETIKVAAPGGGYIMSSSNSIHPGCKPENYIAMVKTAHKYGSTT